jgi:hypothetical protein
VHVVVQNWFLRWLGVAVAAALSVTVAVQGSMLRGVSRRLEKLEAGQSHEPGPRLVAAGAPLLRLTPVAPAALTARAGAPSAVSLRDALSTPEGRDQLKATLASLKEEKRQQRMVERVEKREVKDRRWRDRVLALRSLTPAEAEKVTALFARLQDDRRRALESMKGGHLTSVEADDASDDLARALKKNVRALLGEQRWKELKDEERRLGRDKDLAAMGEEATPAR